MMMKILTQYLHVVLVGSVCIHSSQSVEHSSSRLLWKWTEQILRNPFISNQDSFQRFVVHYNTGFLNHCPLT